MLTFVFQHQMVLWNMSRGHKIVLKHSRGRWWQYIKDGTGTHSGGAAVVWQHGTLSRPRASAADAMVRFQSCSHHWVCYNTHTYTHIYNYTYSYTYNANTHTHTCNCTHTNNSNHAVTIGYSKVHTAQYNTRWLAKIVMYSPGEFPIMQVLLGGGTYLLHTLWMLLYVRDVDPGCTCSG